MLCVILYVFERKLYIIGVMLMALIRASAQQEPSFAHYWALEPSFNPAAVGKAPVINVTGSYAMSMTGFENNPKTMLLAGDMPVRLLNGYHGVGLQLMNDDIGLFTHQRLAVQYANKQRLFGGTLSVGIQIGMLSEKFKGSQLDLDDTSDEAFSTTDVTGNALDLAVGLYYQHRLWYAGLSVSHATAPSIELGERSIIDISRTYYLTGGYNIQLTNPLLSIHPSVLARTDGTAYRVDVTTRLKYEHENKKFYAGVAYSPTNSVTALIGGVFHGISLGYSYEAYTNSAIGLGKGSHELFVGYQTTLDFSKKGRNRHQSVRIL
ncbi:MAG: type IX secretion system membrane protein PorP/SprF [Prevotella sp.]|jgi:type IX secretion system PorP/SprF family membrane protein|nr:type IX secretion system membrane protein PorP/SprF [Prevotella sp.]MBQ5493817.1 type IX secretion system membrane protein PorP/SprF [Prevotella sp.]MBQ5548515.1 type IX secretion system membrane protein PorP/SprF [Prevotella sp.]